MGLGPHGATVLLRKHGSRATTTDLRTGALAPELMAQSAGRLRILALLYAFTFFMSDFFPNLLSAQDRAIMFGDPVFWVPGATSIAVALLLALVVFSPRTPVPMAIHIGLAFQIVSCYGIAAAEYLVPIRLNMNGWIGLSWVGAWAPLFTVVIPTRPRKALLFTLASVSAVPVTVGFMVVTRRTTFNPPPEMFFFWVVFPYLLITMMAYVCARVVYSLGKAVTEARELGSYQLVERLGQGGMGEVWRAKHRLLARPAAIKLIRSNGAPPERSTDAVTRFEREAQVTAGLSSPHTVQLFDFGIADDGTFYFVMELLDGMDLETLVRKHGPLPAERVVYLLRQVCHSLAEADAHGLVHRDIKPANIFVCRYGGEYDFVKVLDFGIAKVARDVMETGAAGLTRDHVVQGTPAFIAPEQALDGSGVDGRTDIYATGCVAYFLLTGEPVFIADTPLAVVVHHVNTPPAPPSQRTELPIPQALERLILECLAKDPAQRPQSARELSRRLAEIPAAADWSDAHARAWWDIHQPGERPLPRDANVSG